MQMHKTMAAAVALGAAMTAGGALAQDEVKDVAWGGSSPGGVMYYMVGTAGTVLSRDLPDINVTQVTTGGSTENAKRLIKGELDMGIVYGSHVYLAQTPEGPFANGPKGDMLRGVGKAYEGPTYFVTLEENGIESVSDLEGKTVALGPPGSGTVFNCTNILKALDMQESIEPRMMTFADAGRALGNRQIDAFCQSSAPAAAVSELAETHDVNVIPYTDEEMAKIEETYPFYYAADLPADMYKGVPQTTLPYTTVYWVAHERVPKETVKKILAHMYDTGTRKELESGHRNWKQLSPSNQNFAKLGAPMHPGAEEFYKEQGMWEE
ncbi:TRAP transporter solute receptor, TAXI family precursor [Caenispirillum salinarum AK4]|uniref:TRAP transporter solute receptor, TAXI family n=1 Tax=Caenispirillum salinarum AK4 TaxID=1238182 RepID=K9GIZ3_9PROT|nr:TAXI family TRAP transporter solute-binding subunit [Caenispirillum salinarum]EKV25950.1 TRAP transporter solute receptor, TAXI family precursor [Caenispirillum salinarum AK4]